jgi:hypothetical protein
VTKEAQVRITIGHQKSVVQAIEAADQAVDQVFKGLPMGCVEIVGQQKEWTGPVMTFGLTAKLGLLKYPLRGTVEVTNRQWIVDVDLLMFGKLLPNRAERLIEARWRGLLS